MKFYVIAGEASGDLHGSNLINALKQLNPLCTFRAWGGDRMAAAGADVVRHYKDLAFMGFWEVLRNLRTIMGNLKFCKADIFEHKPDALILIDYPGFNLRIAKWAKQEGIKVFYYISPQVWAWHQSRVHAIRRDVDEMLVILPFEETFYAQHGMNVHFVGHPLLDAIGPEDTWGGPESKTIAMLPGSRIQEVQRILPPMARAADHFPDHDFVVAGTPTLPDEAYQTILHSHPNIRLEKGKTYEILRHSRAALVKSGTSTLETALFGVPQVVCYKGNSLSYAIARRLVDVKYISLVNLILDAPLVKELIQHELTAENIRRELELILQEKETQRIREGYETLKLRLGDGGASGRAASIILQKMK